MEGLLGRGGRVGNLGCEGRWLIHRDGLFSFEFAEGGGDLRSGSVLTAFSCADPAGFAVWLAAQTPAALSLVGSASTRKKTMSTMTRAALAWHATVGYGVKTDEPFGRELAKRVADFLEASPSPNGISQRHRDYCGMGLFFSAARGVFEHNDVHDGFPSGPAAESFGTRTAFVDWLAGQSDASLRGPLPGKADLGRLFLWDNQRLTKEAIERAMKEGGCV